MWWSRSRTIRYSLNAAWSSFIFAAALYVVWTLAVGGRKTRVENDDRRELFVFGNVGTHVDVIQRQLSTR
jgi:hypothetical protein